MKKLGLLSIIGCSVSGVAIAAGVDCNTIPTCAEIGYTKTATDCEGKVMLRCPFDITNDNAVFCADGELCSDEFNLDACPANGDCEECGGKQKFNGCNSGYSLADGNVCCSDEYYNLDNKPDNATVEQCGNKYHFTGCSTGYTQDGSTTNCCSDEYYNLTAKPDNATVEQCGNKYHFVGCEEGYTEENGSCKLPTGIGCTSVGSILYNDLNCYDTAPSGKTAIGVVFDTENRLAIGLTQASRIMYWWRSLEDVSGLENCTDSSTVKTSCGTSGKTNSAALVAAGYTNASYAAGYCYNQTTGGLAKGDWFLPSLKELNTIYTNKSTIDTAITSVGGTNISSYYYWSSTEFSSLYVWGLYMYNGIVNHRYKNDTGNYYARCAVAF